MGRYSASGDAGGQVREFKEMVRGLHRAGIEVFLDVVYNHTAEGGRDGPTLSFRGLDNLTYYRRPANRPDQYENFSGTGNTFNTQHPAVVRLVMDSLRYWVEEMHVDGFRFDLASSLGRDEGGFTTWSRLLTAIYQEPALRRVKLIAEPWDLGPDGYQVGRFPNNWSEWNDRFRNTTRAFWLGHQATLGEFALRLTGSADLFDRPARGPLSTINYVTCHDGFDLTDLVSYNHKHNEANGEANRDGSNDNLGYNFGVEGPTDDPAVLDARYQARRNLMTTLMLSHGVPMMLGGDELCQTQEGNNNAYCQDNPISWLDWSLDEREREFLEFVRHLIFMRNTYACLRPRRYVESESPAPHEPGVVSWHDADGTELMPGPWNRQAPRVLMLTIEPQPHTPPQSWDTLLILFNASEVDANFKVPRLPHRRKTDWIVVMDTSWGDGKSDATMQSGESVKIRGCSIVVATAH
jgi:isoamylase